MKFFTALTFLISIGCEAQNLVVIGSFSKKENAVALAERAKASYEIDAAQQLYHVYVSNMTDHQAAISEVLRLRKDTPYKDAWVLSEGVQHPKDIVNEIVSVTSAGGPKDVPAEVAPPNEEIKEEPKTNDNSIVLDPKAMAKDFYFLITRPDGTKADDTEVAIIEPKSQRKEYTVKGNENTTVKAINQTGDMRLECAVIGYRKIIQHINFKEPVPIDGVVIENNRITIPFELVRLRKGDHSILYNVFFYKDAAIMKPESKYDLDGLLAMMNENPRYKIRIQGHTNGHAGGPILEVGDKGDFFSLNGAKEGNGSAKKLSGKRAEAIVNYLVAQGVDAKRMSTKAWGGKMPIYDKFHTQAYANVRVEVEVVEE
jgi:outer membrane protein OmpA-like peptidoglycan-associated protein